MPLLKGSFSKEPFSKERGLTGLGFTLVCTLGCQELRGPTDGTLSQIKRQQEQRLMMTCVAENGGGVTGAIGLAVVEWCREDAEVRVW